MPFEIKDKDGTTRVAQHLAELPVDEDFTEDTVRWLNNDGEVLIEMSEETIGRHIPGL
jgi:hypothetical protein